MKRRAASHVACCSKRASHVAFLDKAEAKASQKVSSKRYGSTSPLSSSFLDRALASEKLFGKGGFSKEDVRRRPQGKSRINLSMAIPYGRVADRFFALSDQI